MALLQNPAREARSSRKMTPGQLSISPNLAPVKFERESLLCSPLAMTPPSAISRDVHKLCFFSTVKEVSS